MCLNFSVSSLFGCRILSILFICSQTTGQKCSGLSWGVPLGMSTKKIPGEFSLILLVCNCCRGQLIKKYFVSFLGEFNY